MAADDVIVIPEGAHSVLGPSSAERWMNCPGSTGGDQTEYAAEGTAAHTLSEWVRTEGKPAAHWKGKVLKVGDFQFKVGKNMIDSVQTFVDACAAVPGVPVVEGRVAYEELVTGGFGTLDDARLKDYLCTLTDLKHGKGVKVFAKDNPQLKLYALGLFFELGWVFRFDKFVLRVSQPRLHHFEEWETSVGSLLQWGYDVVRPAALRVHPGAPRVAGPWCKFCGYKMTCSTRAAYKVSHETGTFKRDVDSELDFLNE